MNKLDWDTNFFGKSVFKIESSLEDEILKSLQNIPKNSLLYVFSDKEIPEMKDYLVDKKVTFELLLNTVEEVIYPEECITYSESFFSREDLDLLSIEASRYSRYRRDHLINKEKVDELYRKWIDRALGNNLTEIIGVEDSKKLVGMIVIKASGDCHQIELISVDKEHYRKGIGGKLMRACLARAFAAKVPKISVVTQLDNIEACGLYSKYGFKVATIKYLYHIHK